MDKLYTLEEVEEILGMSESTVLHLLSSGELTGFRLRVKDWRVTETALKSFIQAKEIETAIADGHADKEDYKILEEIKQKQQVWQESEECRLLVAEYEQMKEQVRQLHLLANECEHMKSQFGGEPCDHDSNVYRHSEKMKEIKKDKIRLAHLKYLTSMQESQKEKKDYSPKGGKTVVDDYDYDELSEKIRQLQQQIEEETEECENLAAKYDENQVPEFYRVNGEYEQIKLKIAEEPEKIHRLANDCVRKQQQIEEECEEIIHLAREIDDWAQTHKGEEGKNCNDYKEGNQNPDGGR